MELKTKELNYSGKTLDASITVNYEKNTYELTLWAKKEDSPENRHELIFSTDSLPQIAELIEILQKTQSEYDN